MCITGYHTLSSSLMFFFFFSSRRRHTRFKCDWSSDVCSSDLSAAEALDWLTNSGLSVTNVDPDGKFFIIRRQLDAERWSDALDSVKALKPADFQQTPVLNYVAGGAYLVQTVDEELRTFVLWNLPFDSAPIPLA